MDSTHYRLFSHEDAPAEEPPDVGKVLLVAPEMQPRGTCEYTLNLARELKRRDVDLSVFCSEGGMLGALEDLVVDVRTFKRLDRSSFFPGPRRRFLKAVEDCAPDIVHGQSFSIAPALRLIRRKDVPMVLTVHWRPRRARAFRRFARSLAGIIATTQDVREEIVNQCRVPRQKVKVIHNGVDPERLEAAEMRPVFSGRVPVVGSLGPVEEMRGHELFVRAVAILVTRGVKAQFVVAGKGDRVPELRRLITDLDIDRWVTVSSEFGSYTEVLDALDIVVQSSQMDVSGYSILEAMGHGRPVVAFNTGTACEMVEDKATGLLVSKGDVPALADAVQYLLSDTNVAMQMGEKARAAVTRRFSIAAIASETLRFYGDVVRGRRGHE